ncbi:MAG TPA: energy transducer TonB [Blastocatellia bacterium]
MQAMPASDLDARLPGLPFASWLEQVVGPKAGTTWQLAECGKRIISAGEMERDLPACAEFNALLPDKRRVFITINVGTFKKGLIGKPAFFGAVIDRNATLHQVRQLYELPEMLRAMENVFNSLPKRRSTRKTKNRIARLPVINAGAVKIAASFAYPPWRSSTLPGPRDLTELPPPPLLSLDLEKVSESVLQGRAIKRVKPVYPPSARKLNAAGTVQVEVTISETGLVIDARAIGGHLALRSAAVEAARKWIFKPAIFNDAPVKIKGVLTFTFGPGAR